MTHTHSKGPVKGHSVQKLGVETDRCSGVTTLQWARMQVFQKGPLFPQKTF